MILTNDLSFQNRFKYIGGYIFYSLYELGKQLTYILYNTFNRKNYKYKR